VFTLDAVLQALKLEQQQPNCFKAKNLNLGGSVVFGGQLLAQSIVAGLIGHEGKTVKTLQTVFARSASPDTDIDIEVDPIHDGRSFASSTVTIRQAGRICTRSTVLLCADGPDLIRHADEPARWSAPVEAAGSSQSFGPWQLRIVGDVDVSDPDAVGPPELDVWARCPDAPAEPALDQALVAFLTEGFLIGAAMRPHPGVGQSQAHVSISSGVLSHTLTFHESCSAAEWLLLQQRSVYAGRGKGYGYGNAFREDGSLVASFVQDSMIRQMPAAHKGPL
jgi:acyl-CoA thioesterase-2